MSAAFKENVPLSEEDWRDEWAKAKTHEGGIHEYVGAHSASAFQTDEYLSLKVIWNFNTVNGLVKGPWATFFDTKHGGMKGQRLHLQSFDDEWVHYLGRIPAPGETQMNLFEEPYPKELGRFALALHSQLEVRTPGNRKGGHETSKLIFSRPVTRSQTKPGSRSSSRRPLIHDRDSPGPIQSSSSSSGLEEHSPAGPQERALLPTGDEQVVNAALVNFLNALFLRDNKHSSWTMDRKRFVFQSKKTGVQFTAITDGHLRIENVESSAAIIEVKARHRHAEFGGKIEMQESAQMANWIFQEPNSHWSRDRLDPKHQYVFLRNKEYRNIS